MKNNRAKNYQKHEQKDAYSSPWSLTDRMRLLAWNICSLLLFRPTPKFMNKWRLLLLRVFGAKIKGNPFVSASAKIYMPWNLMMEHRACIGTEVNVYNLAPVILKARCTVAQQAYLCCGTHDLSSECLPLVTGKIIVGPDAFIGARSFVLLNVRIGEGTVVGAMSLVSKDLPDWMICAGNPCKPIRKRNFTRVGS